LGYFCFLLFFAIFRLLTNLPFSSFVFVSSSILGPTSYRTRVIPSVELQDLIWPWIDAELEKVWSIRDKENAPNNAGVTAASFLVFLKHLRIITIQDAAAMRILIPERNDHVIFKSSVFQSSLFAEFEKEMKLQLLREVTTERATAETVLPGVHRRFDTLEVGQIIMQKSQDTMAAVLDKHSMALEEWNERVLEAAKVLPAGPVAELGEKQQQQQQQQDPGDPIRGRARDLSRRGATTIYWSLMKL
jgi:hypothetical protein